MDKLKKNTKFIFVVGGVISGVGKGIAASSIGAILKARGFIVTALKIDPYVNVDAGTMNPTEHGEVSVLDDGTETDQDMLNYERFMGINLSRDNYMTTGSVYQEVINKERRGEYKGKCVQVVPDFPNEVIKRIKGASKAANSDITLIEIGGTVGEYENILFLEACRFMKIKYPKNILTVIVSYVPNPSKIGEMKTKPTQHAVQRLNSAGIQPDIIIARSETPLDGKRKEKISLFCNVREECVISAPDVESIYSVPINFEKDKLSDLILKKFNLKPKETDMAEWHKLAGKIKNPEISVKIGIVGKYFNTGEGVLLDAYISVLEAVKHACYFYSAGPEIIWLNSEDYEKDPSKLEELKNFHGVIVPGGFGSRGVEGKIKAIEFLRVNKIPFLGLCYGMQLAAVEFARNVLGLKGAHTTEINKKTKYPVIDILPEQKKNLKDKNFGASMRLGAYPAIVMPGTKAFKAYKAKEISERHRHRYEINPLYINKFEQAGLIFSGKSPNGNLMEILELPPESHPFFLAAQFHPEFKSNPFNPHPLFLEFIKIAIENRLVPK